MTPWSFDVQDTFPLDGRGVMATGQMHGDAVGLMAGSEVWLVEPDTFEATLSTVREVERFRPVQPPHPVDGERIGLLFRPEERPKAGWRVEPR